jgi:hypothetical protein
MLGICSGICKMLGICSGICKLLGIFGENHMGDIISWNIGNEIHDELKEVVMIRD